ncbi:uncharacterized protein LOC117121105 [Anneissia japonica]|uniref:uncharacterized protein LOC117121105 n=1 Tax=Anneissia japonica TaxID=1529436 RepID=UPI0014258463|nr:uncharacterized protein LOC117121105 [Anneissia japonica]
MPPKKKRKIAPSMPPTEGRVAFGERYSKIPDDAKDLLNGHLVLKFMELKSVGSTLKYFADHMGLKIAYHKVQSLVNRTVKKYKHFNREFEVTKLLAICDEKFSDFGNQTSTELPSSSSVLEPAPLDPETSSAETEALIEVQSSSSVLQPTPLDPEIPPAGTETLTEVPSSLSLLQPTPVDPLTVAVRSLQRKRILTPFKKRLLQQNVTWRERYRCLQKKYAEMRRRNTKTRKSAVQIKNKYLKQELNRMKDRLLKEKRKVDLISNTKERSAAKRKIKRLEKKKMVSVVQYDKILKENKELKKKLKEKDEALLLRENKCLELEEALKDAVKEQEKMWNCKRDGTTFSNETRELVYNMLNLGVPTQHIEELIVKSGSTFGYNVVNQPKRSSAENMARELGAISDFQCAQFMLASANLTLGFDATTQEGTHVNGVYISSNVESMVIALDELPGGTHIDYESHIKETINNLAHVYSMVKNENVETVHRNLVDSISNTLTDRATVNHATIMLLEKTWKKNFQELNCHLHPLETIAKSCGDALSAVEREREIQEKTLFGSGCIGQRIVFNVNKLRYKDGKGDPRQFKTELVKAGLKKGFIPRYRGNRLHILFHIAGQIFMKDNFFTNLFVSGLSSVKLSSALSVVFKTKHAKIELQVLGLIGRIISSPWMGKFYVSAVEQLNHLDAFDIIRHAMDKINKFARDPYSTLTTKVNCFGEELVDASKMQVQPVDRDLFLVMMKQCLEATSKVLHRQFSKYFEIDITEELKEQTASARLHNIEAEQMMGMFSARKTMKPNATIDYIACGIKARKNKTTSFLHTLDNATKQRLMNTAISIGRLQRKVRKRTTKEVEAEIRKRIEDKGQQRNDAARKKMEKELKAKGLDKLLKEKEEWKGFEDQLQVIMSGKLSGYLQHIWYDSETRKLEVYCGAVKKFLKGKSVYRIEYWGTDESYEDDAESYDIPMYSLAIDLTVGDLVLQ